MIHLWIIFQWGMFVNPSDGKASYQVVRSGWPNVSRQPPSRLSKSALEMPRIWEAATDETRIKHGEITTTRQGINGTLISTNIR
jgi:hypothetical protein